MILPDVDKAVIEPEKLGRFSGNSICISRERAFPPIAKLVNCPQHWHR